MAVTLHEVAEQAGVDVSTVSRALNNKSNVNEGTKKRIWQVAQTLGYRPNRARSLVTKRTNTLGLVMPSIKCLGHTLFGWMLEGISCEAERLGYSLSFSVVDVDIQGEEAAITKLVENRVDGLILGWFKEKYIGESRLVQLAQRQIPFVVIGDRHLSSQDINMIACDNFLGAYKATQHLIDLGHGKIATISGPADNPIVQNRFAGFNAALEQAGIYYSEQSRQRLSREGDFRKYGGGEEAMQSLLDDGGDFTAVFAFSDMFAAEAIRAIQQRGLNVPKDYAVVGFDGAEYGRLLHPSLTTVQQPYREIGQKAVQMLKQLIAGEELVKSCVWIEPQLIVRESCGAQRSIPVIGWLAGLSLRDFISGIDHWIAFGLLSLIGCKMIYESTKVESSEKEINPLSLYVLLLLSVATSIDALAVGISFSFLNIPIAFSIIVIATVTIRINLSKISLISAQLLSVNSNSN